MTKRSMQCAYVEVEHGTLVCPCGTRTDVPGSEMGIGAQAKQHCSGCGRVWWIAATVSCEEVTA